MNFATDLIGWAAAAILLLTLGRQVYTQWRDRTSKGVSKWLFVGQCAASAGFVVYSGLLKNWVFVVTNALILVTAVAGESSICATDEERANPAPDPGDISASSCEKYG